MLEAGESSHAEFLRYETYALYLWATATPYLVPPDDFLYLLFIPGSLARIQSVSFTLSPACNPLN